MGRIPVSFAGIIPLAACGLILTGCVEAPRAYVLAVHPSAAQLQAVRRVQPDYVYYPDYEIYYSRNYQRYIYRDNDVWLIRAEAPVLYAAVLPTARFAPMSFHDDPRRHHDEIARIFPRHPGDAPAALASNP